MNVVTHIKILAVIRATQVMAAILDKVFQISDIKLMAIPWTTDPRKATLKCSASSAGAPSSTIGQDLACPASTGKS